MVVDVIVVVLILTFALVGMYVGFLRGILDFVSTFIIIIISVVIARPFALLLDRWFGIAGPLSSIFQGESALDEMARNNGLLLLTAIIAVVLFIVIKVVIAILRRKIMRWKERFPSLNSIDKTLGFFLGLFKFMVYATIFSGFLFIITSIAAFSGLHDWLLEGSTVVSWLYDVCLNIIGPLLRVLGARVGEMS
ncbi:MAG: CvpA family protein [Firmicutes bacterium]|nr:CvpA family protein [Bacillota bacterium]